MSIQKKLLLIITIFISTLYSSENFSIKPKADIILRYSQKDITYSPLGVNVNKQDSSRYSDAVIGGDIGFKVASGDFDFVILGTGVARVLKRDSNKIENEETYFDNNLDEFFYLSNIYLHKAIGKSSIKIGRQSYSDNLVNSNKRVTSNVYEGVYSDYKDDIFKISMMYFDKVASSTLANAVPFNHNYGALGYGKGYQVGKFVSLSEHISNKKYSTKGAIIINTTFGDTNKNINIQNLYVDNFFNTFDITGKYSFNIDKIKVDTKLGAIVQNDIGENSFAKDYGNKQIKGKMIQGMLGFNYEKFFGSYTYAYTPYDKDAVLNGTIISSFSNKVGWIVAPQSAHSFIADTISNKFTLGTKFIISNKKVLALISRVRYDIGSNNGFTSLSLRAKENYLHIKTLVNKNLNVTFQYSRAKEIDLLTKQSNSIRLFANYTF